MILFVREVFGHASWIVDCDPTLQYEECLKIILTQFFAISIDVTMK